MNRLSAEIKLDGYRIGCAIDGGHVRLHSRRKVDWTNEFPVVAAGAKRLKVRTALLDGEVAAVLPDGRTSCHAMQTRPPGGGHLVYFVFDILHLDGDDLLALPVEERTRRLEIASVPYCMCNEEPVPDQARVARAKAAITFVDSFGARAAGAPLQ